MTNYNHDIKLSDDLLLRRRSKGGRRTGAAIIGGVLALAAAGAATAHHVFVAGGPEDPRIEFAFEEPTSANTHITETISWGVEFEVEYTEEKNFNLDDSDDEDEAALEPVARLFASYEPSENFRAFTKIEFGQDFFLEHPDGDDPDAELSINEAYLAFRDVAPGLSVIVGRQDIEDEREWFSDRVLDGVRLVQRHGDFALEAMAMRQELAQSDLLGDHNDQRQDNLYMRGYWGFSEDSQASLYTLYRNARRERDEDLLFLGGQSFGKLAPNIDYWAEGAFVLGEADGRDVSGFGFDLGATYEFRNAPLRPSATLGVAFGAGDDGDGDDTAFRQTGLHDNNGRFNGVSSFKYYGEAFEPELSNMGILTFGVGVRPTRRSSVDLVFHKYLQHRKSDEIRDTSISADPTGLSKDLGQEVDLVIGIREIENIAIEAVAGVFLPGEAFEEEDPAYRFRLQIRYGF